MLSTTIDTIAGVVRVENSGDLPESELTLVARIGSAEGGADSFGRIRSILADGDGNIYVADNLAHEIRVFNSRGSHIRTLGGQGAGPGEFRDLYSLAWIGDTLAAMDPRNARIALLTRQGEWVDGIQHYPLSGPPLMIRLHPLGTEGFYAPIIGKQGLPLVRWTRAGAADTVLAPRVPPGARSGGIICHRPDGGVTGISVPDGPTLVYAFKPPEALLAVAWTNSYTVTLLAGADTARVINRVAPSVPYADSLWQQAMQPYNELMTEFPGTKCDPPTPVRPASRAALRHILFDELGQLWVEAATQAGFAWEVFDSQGRLMARHPAPPRSTNVPPYVRGGHLYQVEEDSLGVQQVAVYRVSPRT